jgi:hypothetical protein
MPVHIFQQGAETMDVRCLDRSVIAKQKGQEVDLIEVIDEFGPLRQVSSRHFAVLSRLRLNPTVRAGDGSGIKCTVGPRKLKDPVLTPGSQDETLRRLLDELFHQLPGESNHVGFVIDLGTGFREDLEHLRMGIQFYAVVLKQSHHLAAQELYLIGREIA